MRAWIKPGLGIPRTGPIEISRLHHRHTMNRMVFALDAEKEGEDGCTRS